MGPRPRSHNNDRYRHPSLLDFTFNGWGLKFASELDNQITKHAVEAGALKGQYIDHLDFVLEGGSIESDGMGTLLTTSKCLLSPTKRTTEPGRDRRIPEINLPPAKGALVRPRLSGR